MVADGKFYFLEMNTRLQVEHPVTEMVTGIDLVQAQLRIASGQPLDLEYTGPRGHAIECRITAEDPFNNFLPGGGKVEELRAPAGPGVRWDAGIVQGSEIGLHYDSLVAKLIVHGEDRAAAIARMARALDELVIEGATTIAPFHQRVMKEPDFIAGRFHTGYLDDHPDLLADTTRDSSLKAAALVAALLEDEERRRLRIDAPAGHDVAGGSGWRWPPRRWTGRGWGIRT